jgi:hypothetical protein
MAVGLASSAYVDYDVISGSTYYYVVTAVDSGGESAMSSEAFASATTDTRAPQVASASYLYLFSPHQLSVHFDENVSVTLSIADISVQNLTSTDTFNPTGLSYDVTTNTATFSFPGGPLPDGDYRATLTAADISDPAGNALDGDANETAGGNWSFDFFFLNGDANRDRSVDTIDFNLLAANFGQSGRSFSQGNFDYSPGGTVDTVDFNLLASNFGKTLARGAAAASVALSGAAQAAGMFSQTLVATGKNDLLTDLIN